MYQDQNTMHSFISSPVKTNIFKDNPAALKSTSLFIVCLGFYFFFTKLLLDIYFFFTTLKRLNHTLDETAHESHSKESYKNNLR